MFRRLRRTPPDSFGNNGKNGASHEALHHGDYYLRMNGPQIFRAATQMMAKASEKVTATVTVTGPCGLDGTLGGNALVLDVATAPAGPTPVVTPVQLPVTGGQPTTGVGAAWTLWVTGVFAILTAIGTGAMSTRRYGKR